MPAQVTPVHCAVFRLYTVNKLKVFFHCLSFADRGRLPICTARSTAAIEAELQAGLTALRRQAPARSSTPVGGGVRCLGGGRKAVEAAELISGWHAENSDMLNGVGGLKPVYMIY